MRISRLTRAVEPVLVLDFAGRLTESFALTDAGNRTRREGGRQIGLLRLGEEGVEDARDPVGDETELLKSDLQSARSTVFTYGRARNPEAVGLLVSV